MVHHNGTGVYLPEHTYVFDNEELPGVNATRLMIVSHYEAEVCVFVFVFMGNIVLCL